MSIKQQTDTFLRSRSFGSPCPAYLGMLGLGWKNTRGFNPRKMGYTFSMPTGFDPRDEFNTTVAVPFGMSD